MNKAEKLLIEVSGVTTEISKGEEQQMEHKFVGVGFLKTRMAEWKVKRLVEKMEKIAGILNTELVNVIVDHSGGRDIDRKALDDLYDWIDGIQVQILVIDDLLDITDDQDDFQAFMQDMNDRGIIIFCVRENRAIVPSYLEELAGENFEE